MKKLFMLFLALGFLAVQDTYAAEHSNFGTFWNFGKGEPEPWQAYIEWHMKKFSRYVDTSMSRFEQEEMAQLFGEVKYHFDNGLELDGFHNDPNDYLVEKLGESVLGYRKCVQQRRDDLGDCSYKQEKFKVGMLHLARYFVIGYHALPLEEQDISNDYDYGVNGVYHENAGARVFGNIKTVSKSLHNAGIPRTQAEVLANARTMVEKLRDESCVQEDARTEHEKRFKPLETHACLYATLLTKYVKLAQETLCDE